MTMTNFRKIILLFFSIIYITNSFKLTHLCEPLRSKKYLKNQFWTKNFGLNLDDYNNPLKSFLLKISDEIIEKSSQKNLFQMKNNFSFIFYCKLHSF